MYGGKEYQLHRMKSSPGVSADYALSPEPSVKENLTMDGGE